MHAHAEAFFNACLSCSECNSITFVDHTCMRVMIVPVAIHYYVEEYIRMCMHEYMRPIYTWVMESITPIKRTCTPYKIST